MSSPCFELLHTVAHTLEPYFAVESITQNMTLSLESHFAMSQTVVLKKRHRLQCCKTWPEVLLAVNVGDLFDYDESFDERAQLLVGILNQVLR